MLRLPFPSCTDRKSTRMNSSHRCISYAVFCLKKKQRRAQRGRGHHPADAVHQGRDLLSDAEVVFFFKDAATPEIYTLPLPDALPISIVTSAAEAPSTIGTELCWQPCGRCWRTRVRICRSTGATATGIHCWRTRCGK